VNAATGTFLSQEDGVIKLVMWPNQEPTSGANLYKHMRIVQLESKLKRFYIIRRKPFEVKTKVLIKILQHQPDKLLEDFEKEITNQVKGLKIDPP
jgi:BMFP domain-containing protein YqiC